MEAYLERVFLYIGYLLSYDLSRPDHDQLQQQVDTFMVKFKADEYEKEREAMERMSKMDEDGFVVVSRTKKRSRATDGEVAVQSFGAATFDPSKVKKKELTDFYRFQVREAKKNGEFWSNIRASLCWHVC